MAKKNVTDDFSLEKIAERLRSNRMDAYIAPNPDSLLSIMDELISDDMTVANGGSVTLSETGVIEYLRGRRINFLDKEKARADGVEAVRNVELGAFSADAYVMSTNALTSKGWLYNVDGKGNRVAALVYGPKSVIVICGKNKLVKSVKAAHKRLKSYTAPANCERLALKTPCVRTKTCMDCSSNDRICNAYTVVRKSNIKGRIKVILLDFEAGY